MTKGELGGRERSQYFHRHEEKEVKPLLPPPNPGKKSGERRECSTSLRRLGEKKEVPPFLISHQPNGWKIRPSISKKSGILPLKLQKKETCDCVPKNARPMVRERA